MSATDSFEADIINHFLKNSAIGASQAYAALSTTVPNEDASNWTELTGGGYARQIVSLGAITAGTVTTSSALTFGPATGANWPTALALGIFFVSSGGTLKLRKTISAKTALVGESISWAAGDLTFTIA